MAQNMQVLNNMHEMQMGGKKRHSIIHNILIVSAIIQRNQAEKVPTYLFFGDAEKCFDKFSVVAQRLYKRSYRPWHIPLRC